MTSVNYSISVRLILVINFENDADTKFNFLDVKHVLLREFVNLGRQNNNWLKSELRKNSWMKHCVNDICMIY